MPVTAHMSAWFWRHNNWLRHCIANRCRGGGAATP